MTWFSKRKITHNEQENEKERRGRKKRERKKREKRGERKNVRNRSFLLLQESHPQKIYIEGLEIKSFREREIQLVVPY